MHRVKVTKLLYYELVYKCDSHGSYDLVCHNTPDNYEYIILRYIHLVLFIDH
jgi:hypothetical protein